MFFKSVIEIYAKEFLRRSTYIDVKNFIPINIVYVIIVRTNSSCWKLLPRKTYESVMISLVFLGTTISTLYINLPYATISKTKKYQTFSFLANDENYKLGYIWNGWHLFKSISLQNEDDLKRVRYKQAHEAARKDGTNV